jgi:farnesyl-diphosphate farnesyltransferase
LVAAGLQPVDLLQPVNHYKFRPLYHRYLDLAEAHLAAGWSYTNTIPRGQVRVRLACAWPILIGRETLALLRTANVLDPNQRIKVDRAEVRRIFLRTVLRYPRAQAWSRLAPLPA